MDGPTTTDWDVALEGRKDLHAGDLRSDEAGPDGGFGTFGLALP